MFLHPLIEIGVCLVWKEFGDHAASGCDDRAVGSKFETHVDTSIRRRPEKAFSVGLSD